MDDETKDPAEAIALYRSHIIGILVRREMEHGDLARALAELSTQRFMPPRSHSNRTYSVPTLERWYYAFKGGGLDALMPKARKDKGRARVLSPELRKLLVDIRFEHPSASVPLILATLTAEGKLAKGDISPVTVRRLYSQEGLDRRSLRAGGVRDKVRLRWQAEHPGALWHGDVCHAHPLKIGDETVPVRIHALLDDASRYVVAIEARSAERELDMLAIFVRALRRYGNPEVLYLDNGATYRGEALELACARLGITLLHARPYDAPARGKMERFWRTLREGCLDHAGSLGSLHDLNVRLYAWLDEHYHQKPHAALMGKSPVAAFGDAEARGVADFDEKRLRDAFITRARRRVRRDNTLAVDGEDWETPLHFLAGKLVTVGRSMVDTDESPWIEFEGKPHSLTRVNPIANARRGRPKPTTDGEAKLPKTPFDPSRTFLDKALGKTSKRNGGAK